VLFGIFCFSPAAYASRSLVFGFFSSVSVGLPPLVVVFSFLGFLLFHFSPASGLFCSHFRPLDLPNSFFFSASLGVPSSRGAALLSVAFSGAKFFKHPS